MREEKLVPPILNFETIRRRAINFTPGLSYPRERTTTTHWNGGKMGSEAGPLIPENRKSRTPDGRSLTI